MPGDGTTELTVGAFSTERATRADVFIRGIVRHLPARLKPLWLELGSGRTDVNVGRVIVTKLFLGL